MSILLVFDIDGTLTDTVSAHRASFYETLLKYELSGNPGETGYKHHTDSNIFREIYTSQRSDWSEEKLQEFERKLTENIDTRLGANVREIHGAGKFLRELSKNGIPFGYATGSFERPAYMKLERANLPTDVPLSHASRFSERESIVLATIQECEVIYGKKFDQVLSVGDGSWDYKTALNLDLEFLGIAKDEDSANSLRALGASRIVSDYSDLDFLFRGILGSLIQAL